MRLVTYQHWAAGVRKVVAIDTRSGVVTFAGARPSYTGDGPSGSRYYLENAPEYLAKHSGTFYATGSTIRYAPLSSDEMACFVATKGNDEFGANTNRVMLEVISAKPGLLELISNTHTHDIAIENVEIAHTDVDFASCFAGPCSYLSSHTDTHAAVHFEFSSKISMTNVPSLGKNCHIDQIIGGV